MSLRINPSPLSPSSFYLQSQLSESPPTSSAPPDESQASEPLDTKPFVQQWQDMDSPYVPSQPHKSPSVPSAPANPSQAGEQSKPDSPNPLAPLPKSPSSSSAFKEKTSELPKPQGKLLVLELSESSSVSSSQNSSEEDIYLSQ